MDTYMHIFLIDLHVPEMKYTEYKLLCWIAICAARCPLHSVQHVIVGSGQVQPTYMLVCEIFTYLLKGMLFN